MTTTTCWPLLGRLDPTRTAVLLTCSWDHDGSLYGCGPGVNMGDRVSPVEAPTQAVNYQGQMEMFKTRGIPMGCLE